MRKYGILIALILFIIAGFGLAQKKAVLFASPPMPAETSGMGLQNNAAASSNTNQPAGKTAKASLPLDVPLIQQMPELQRGCEVTSLAMLLNDAGVHVDKMTLAKQIPKVPFQKNGLHGNMNIGFVGDIYSFDNPGLGVYAEPVFELGEQYLPGRLVNLTGERIDDIYDWMDAGSPVWVISTSTFGPLDDDEFETWKTPRGPMDVTYDEHSVVLTGYDDKYVYMNDPLDDERNKKVSRKSFEKAWTQMGSQAITYKA